MRALNLAVMASLIATPFVSCGPAGNEQTDPSKADVQVHGRLLRTDGSAAPGVMVQLWREQVVYDEIATDGAGDYAFEVDGDDTDDPEATGRATFTLRAKLEDSADAPEVGVSFVLEVTNVQIPSLRFLEAPLASTVMGDEIVVTVPNYGDAVDRRPRSYDLVISTAQGTELLVREADAAASTIGVHRLWLEDHATKWRLFARLALNAPFSGYAAGRPMELAAQNPTPLSREAACTYTNTDIQNQDDPELSLEPCPLTDGDVATAFAAPGPICVDPDPTDAFEECAASWERLVVDLGEVLDIAFLAVHDMGEGAPILFERSVSGSVYHNVTNIDADGFVFQNAFQARFLRFSYAGDQARSQLSGFNEIVVY